MHWSQLQAVLWLRWRLTRNQFRRAGVVNTVVTVLLGVLGLLAAALGGVGGLAGGAMLGGALGAEKASPMVTLLVWDSAIGAFLFIWMVGLVTEIQRSESIDLARLLHLPVSLKWAFFVNYLASHLSLTLALFLPAMIGLCLGMIWGFGPLMTLMLPLVLGVLFMVTAWTYCLRGWLISLMVNQRRRRTVIAVVTVTMVLLGQLPNIIINVVGPGHWNRGRAPNPRPDSASTAVFLAAHRFVPPLWVGNGARALTEGHAGPAVGGALAAFALGALGLGRAYRSTLLFYRGGKTRKATKAPPSPAPVAVTATPGGRFLERRIPGVPDEAAALALAFFRSLTRAPEVKMMLVMNLVMPLVFGVIFFSRGKTGAFLSPATDKVAPFAASGAVAFTFLSTVQLLLNQFGFDREGFRALVLLPVHRRHILLAKNLSWLPVAIGMGLFFLAVVTVALRVPPLAVLAAGCQLGATFLLLSIVGNFVSVVAPYRIAAGSLKPTKAPGKTTAMIFLTHLLFPLAVAPIFVPPALGLLCRSLDWMPAGPVNFGLSALWLVIVAVLYWLSLGSLGRLLLRREKTVLQAVTQEVE